MNLGLRYLQAIRALSGPLADELQQLVAAIQGGWGREHTTASGHGAVTATSLTTTGLVSTGALMLRPPVQYNSATIIPTGRIDNLWVEGIDQASWLRIYCPVLGVTLTGIKAPITTAEADVGRLLLVTNDSDYLGPYDLQVAALDANSSEGHRFIGDAASRAPWTLHGAESMLLVRDRYWTQRGGAGSLHYGWRVLIG